MMALSCLRRSNWGSPMMKAHEPIDRASFGPDALKAIGRAFDESWFSIAGNFAKDQIETARLRLADVLLSIANDDSRDVETLKKNGSRPNAR
jgi:hypothetical protein